MADVFISYSRADRERAAAVATAVEQDGRSLWWDRRLASGADYALVIEREIAAAKIVLVAWSKTARDSLWVRAEANEALDQGKLVQINLDGAKPPLPFTMIHFLPFDDWSGAREQEPWPELRSRIDAAAGGGAGERAVGRRPDPGGISIFAPPEPALQGFQRVAALGWVALGVAAVVALCVLFVARRLISADAFGVIAVAAAVASTALLALCAVTMLRIERGSRR